MEQAKHPWAQLAADKSVASDAGALIVLFNFVL